ncbi:MAG: hypothetical protein HQL59_08960 [Magnetococcales bacterium]|nr:hypothetical protein [Magnetococcales bacterium]
MCETLSDHRLSVAKDFVHTMIVVDDQASYEDGSDVAVAGAEITAKPSRRAAKETRSDDENQKRIEHRLNVEALTKSAFEHGLVCSVLRPTKNEDVTSSVVRASERVDIVSLDWELFDDKGDIALGLLKRIMMRDAEVNGRLRLVSIYTGDTGRAEILKKIHESFDQTERDERRLTLRDDDIISNDGLRIICLTKAHGRTLTGEAKRFQVAEKDLPERLLREFSDFPNGGLLSNVALAAVASIRRTAHHVVNRFNRTMDGPFLHHRATIAMSEDSGSYALGIIMGELKNAVIHDNVVRRYTGDDAVRRRVAEAFGGSNKRSITYGQSENQKNIEFNQKQAQAMFVDGLRKFAEGNDKPGGFPGKNNLPRLSRCLTSFFEDGTTESSRAQQEFAFLTTVRSHPANPSIKRGDVIPELGLGTIVFIEGTDEYLLCIQASCDSVRVESNSPFVFARLTATRDDKPEFIVPIQDGDAYAGLDVVQRAYTKLLALHFMPDASTGTVLAEKLEVDGVIVGYRFPAIGEDGQCVMKNLRWVADIKRRRVLRTVQRLAQEMGRIGFDEFEPFRKQSSN